MTMRVVNTLARKLSRQIWPNADAEILIKAILLDERTATACWQDWRSRRDLDHVGWHEHKLLARLAARLTRLAPDCSYRPRVEGLAKAHWTHSQVMLRSSAQAIDLLLDREIPVMLLKGGALQAAALAGQGPRIASDLDIMVRRSDFARAVTCLYQAGWTSKDSVEFARVRWRFDSGTNLRLPPHGDIDVHHQPLHGARVSEAVLGGLWSRSEQKNLHGRTVWVPPIADLLVFASAHAVHSQASSEPSATWIFDIEALVAQRSLTADQVVASALAFQAVPATLAVLYYLDQLRPEPVIAELIAALEATGQGVGAWMAFSLAAMKRPHGKLLRSLVRRVRKPAGIEFEQDVVPRIHPRLSRQPTARGASGENPTAQFARRHDIDLPQPLGAHSRVVVEFDFEPVVSRRYQFDVSGDGVPLARLTCRAKSVPPGEVCHVTATIPTVGIAPRRVAIESLARASLIVNPTPDERAAAKPAPFLVRRVAWD